MAIDFITGCSYKTCMHFHLFQLPGIVDFELGACFVRNREWCISLNYSVISGLWPLISDGKDFCDLLFGRCLIFILKISLAISVFHFKTLNINLCQISVSILIQSFWLHIGVKQGKFVCNKVIPCQKCIFYYLNCEVSLTIKTRNVHQWILFNPLCAKKKMF